MLADLALRRLRTLPFTSGSGASARSVVLFQAELAGLGYRLVNPLALSAADEAFFHHHRARMATLAAMRGGAVDYVPLFLEFPDRIPDDDAYFCQRVIGHVGNLLGTFEQGRELEDGTIVPEWLFDLEAFGADPISQMQTRSLFERAKATLAKRQRDTHVEWIDLELVPEEGLETRVKRWFHDVLYARSPIQASWHDDVAALLVRFGPGEVEEAQIAMKETRALVLKTYWSAGALDGVERLAKTPTDLLRLFAAVTDGDVSLSEPVRFPRMSRPERRAVLNVLERAPALEEDLTRYRGLWLAVGRSVHARSYGKTHPRAAGAFAALAEGPLRTFHAESEALWAASAQRQDREAPGGEATSAQRGHPDAIAALLAHLRQRPGVFARRLHQLLRQHPGESERILAAFKAEAHHVPVKVLLVMQSYFEAINDQPRRTVINKRGAIQVVSNNARGALSLEQRRALSDLLAGALVAQLQAKPSWKGRRIYIDPALANYTVPLQLRAASEGLVTVGRGSRLPLDLDKVLRLFVYWKQTARRTDLDLSVCQFDDRFRFVGQVSYTNLKDQGIVHSGDLQSAPEGAAEFIDLTLKGIQPSVRYLAPQVYRYAGEQFGQMTCQAGWMVRDHVDARYATFDIKTVANKVNLTGQSAYCLPFLVDLRAQELVMVDLYLSGKAFENTAEGAHGDVGLACREVADFTFTRPDLYSLAELHVRARGGTQVAELAGADLTVGLGGATHDLTRAEDVLAHWL